MRLHEVRTSWRQNLQFAWRLWLGLAGGLVVPAGILATTGGELVPASVVGRVIFFLLVTTGGASVLLMVFSLIAFAFWPWTRKTVVSREEVQRMIED